MSRQEACLPGSFEEFWFFCFSRWEKAKGDCVKSCELRKRLEIPPFGNSYDGKLEGTV